MAELPPNFVLRLSGHETVVANFTKDLENYCVVSNKCLQLKQESEKGKKAKKREVKLPEMLSYDHEVERIVTDLMGNVPAHLHLRLENVYLRPLFGIKARASILPPCGAVFNSVLEFPN